MTSSVKPKTSPAKVCSYIKAPDTLKTSSLTQLVDTPVARHPERHPIGGGVEIGQHPPSATASEEATTKWVVAVALLLVTSHTFNLIHEDPPPGFGRGTECCRVGRCPNLQ